MKCRILATLPLLTVIVGCGATVNTLTSSSFSNMTSFLASSSSVREIMIPNIKQYLTYAPTRIKVFYDKTLQENPDLFYYIYDPAICKIEDNHVIGLKVGETTVSASTSAGLETSFTVFINETSEYTFGRDVASFQESYKLAGSPKNPTLFVGDSFFDIKNFWKTFQDDFLPNQNCFSVGISSSKTTDWMMFRNLIINDFKPKNIIIHIGTNDINDNSYKMTVDAYYEQITEFLKVVILEHPQTPIYFFGIEKRATSSGYSVNNVYVERVTERIKSVFTLEHDNFHYLDSPSVFNADQSRFLSSDGIHPSPEGYAFYVEALNAIVDF